MPNKSECIEDLLAQIEEAFYLNLKTRETFDSFFGGRVNICFSTKKPNLTIDLKEAQKPGPKLGSKFRIDPGLKAARRLAKQDVEYSDE